MQVGNVLLSQSTPGSTQENPSENFINYFSKSWLLLHIHLKNINFLKNAISNIFKFMLQS